MATRKKQQPPAPLTREQILDIVNVSAVKDRVRAQRFTQDTPISTDVWYLFSSNLDCRRELLLSPNRKVTLRDLFIATREALEIFTPSHPPAIAYNQSHVYVEVNFKELVCVILPLTLWWKYEIPGDLNQQIRDLKAEDHARLVQLLMDPAQFQGHDETRYNENLLHMLRIIGYLARGKALEEDWADRKAGAAVAIATVLDLYRGNFPARLQKIWKDRDPRPDNEKRPPLWRVFTNRSAEGAVMDSRRTVKADAAQQVFSLSTKNLRWAVIDSGIDATHPAFSKSKKDSSDPCHPADSRIARTYDFNRLKPLMLSGFRHLDLLTDTAFGSLELTRREQIQTELESRVTSGLAIDWELLEPVLRMSDDPNHYSPPKNQHGTHVAGILAADWSPDPKTTLRGICPDLELYDFRVFDDDGKGDEFTILAALQFIRYMNLHQDEAIVQGVNLSFSLIHKVESYACGATPVCEECARLVGAGVVVVAAAGNRGHNEHSDDGYGDYRNISITDPGNTEEVITVGATHREMPHKYGVSYFSSRGPTGDGRRKPDLVAPGEKITSVVPGLGKARLDGTSMAAPHVSGAAALLMARHRELIGQPRRIKEILCSTATSLNRESGFQGAGLVDILRALQSV
jgi:serine protease AprX